MPTMDDVVSSSKNCHRDLIVDKDSAVSYTVHVDTTHGTHLSSHLVMSRMYEDEERSRAAN